VRKIVAVSVVLLWLMLSWLTAAERFAILYSGSVQGETEPCG